MTTAPFETPAHRAGSANLTPSGPATEATLPPEVLTEVHSAFRSTVLDEAFSCVGAKSALRQGGYRLGVYGQIGSAEATAGLARDLRTFGTESPALPSRFTTFAAVFVGTRIANEAGFERLLWAQLQALHEADRQHFDWDPAVSADPEAPDFAFSFAGRAYFVVGLHPHSSRLGRRFPWPALIFNPHEQFERLRAEGSYARMQRVIRAREIARQGSINPMLGDFGRRSEARQYSGRAVDDDWRCPFHAGGTE